MTNPAPLNVMFFGAPVPDWSRSVFGPFVTAAVTDLASARSADAVVCLVHTSDDLQELRERGDLQAAAFETAVVVMAPGSSPQAQRELLHAGVQDVVDSTDMWPVSRAVHHAVARKRLEQAARTAYATDLATGLPHQAQLLEHMTQLLALRERQTSPMALIVLRIEGLASAAARQGQEAANVLRRKVAVRLRGALRASDVVASLGPDTFGVLLGHVEEPQHCERVADKLARLLQQPFHVGGQPHAVAAAIGLAQYPEHGKEALALLQRAVAQATSAAAMGREGFATHAERGPAQAANDD